jgi:Holliday junction DNA helicase RuvA
VIGSLRGLLVRKAPPHLLVEVNGVGYELEVPVATCAQLPEVGDEIWLCTHLSVREDQHTLYGFANENERALFRNLLKVNGVGAKLALTVLSGMSVEGFARCVQEEDTASLVQLPGVGRKTAERLIVEMRDRIEADSSLPPMEALGDAARSKNSAETEALHALLSLGYKPAEARRMLDSVVADGIDAAELLRAALRGAGSSG